MANKRITAFVLLLVGVGLGYLVYSTQAVGSKWNFKLGLDLRGGSQLVYKADIAKVAPGEVGIAMDALRDVIERRVNLFGVTEPNVQTQSVNIGVDGTEERLIVELPGVTDIDQAIELIGQTPVLEFKTERQKEESDKLAKQFEDLRKRQEAGENVMAEMMKIPDPYYIDTELTGRFLTRASVEFDPGSGQPYVSLQFNDEGAKLFGEITKANIGKTVAIYLDGTPITQPTVQGEITDGKAQITGGFTPAEAKQLAGRLNSGALPIPIDLVATNKIGATLGEGAFDKGVKAAMAGYLIVAIFLILWYRLPGFVAALALAFYGVIVLSVFKLFGVTLTAAGIAGFILSLGMAVDANVLIFERMKEERRRGKLPAAALEEGFARAWTSIRDSNTSSFITAAILFWFGTSLIKGFALVWMIGILASLISAIVITKRFMRAVYT
jgi:preprotein translocase subunit SecD